MNSESGECFGFSFGICGKKLGIIQVLPVTAERWHWKAEASSYRLHAEVEECMQYLEQGTFDFF